MRIPLAGGEPYSVKSGYSQERNKPGVLRRDGGRDFHIPSNPLGRIADAVWHIPPVVSPSGSHSAAFPEELVRRALLLTAPPCDLPPVATVLDCYAGSGTVSAVAKQFGLRSMYIDQNPIYAAEAQQRVLATKRDPDAANRDPDATKRDPDSGRADFPHPAFSCVIKPSRSGGRHVANDDEPREAHDAETEKRDT